MVKFTIGCQELYGVQLSMVWNQEEKEICQEFITPELNYWLRSSAVTCTKESV
ncbi:hypothetical protein [Nostoc sp. C117]|uniref:hypothetical protein n=1 Tax=Nostoc sp. C117 TaxID=3349875 RepID=UPI00370D1DF3